MTTLAAYAAFLTARWNEIEADAVDVSDGPWYYTADGIVHASQPGERYVAESVPSWNGPHIARHNRAYVLADLTAKRVILAACVAAHQSEVRNPFTSGSIFALHEALVALAEPFRTHPDHPANQEA